MEPGGATGAAENPPPSPEMSQNWQPGGDGLTSPGGRIAELARKRRRRRRNGKRRRRRNRKRRPAPRRAGAGAGTPRRHFELQGEHVRLSYNII